MTPRTIVNGIDVARQRAATGASLPAEHAASTEWLGGTQTRTLVASAAFRTSEGGFAIATDYPDALLGSDTAPSPEDLLMAAIGSSFITSFVLAAAAAEIRIESLRVLTTHTGLERATGANAVSRGRVDLHAEVETDATSAELDELVAIAVEHSHVVALCDFTVRVVLHRVTTAGPGANDSKRGG